MDLPEEAKLPWVDFIALAKERGWAIPPNHEIQFANHYWLIYNPRRHGSGGDHTLKVAQWSPTLRTWFNSNDLASCEKPLNYLRESWDILVKIELPDLELIAQKLKGST